MDAAAAGICGLEISKSESVAVVTTKDPKHQAVTGMDDNASSEDHKLCDVVQNFLSPLKQEILKLKAIGIDEVSKTVETGSSSQPVPPKLLQSLCQFIWEPDMIYGNKGLLRRTYNSMNYHFLIEQGQSDLDDFLEYKPSEVLAYKATQVFIALVLPDLELFSQEMKKFKKLIADRRVSRDGRAETAYLFLYNAFQMLHDLLADEYVKDEGTEVPDFLKLSVPSRCVIHAISVIFVRQFRLKVKERVEIIRRAVQDDSSSLEWCLYLAEILRMKRRESVNSRPQWPTKEELDLVDTVLSMDPQNPFVRLTVIDTVIGCVRDANGRFRCGDINLDNLEDAMRYLHSACQKLVTEFPNNVMYNSIVSDYFARYVPLLYFDADYSLNRLMTAYKLNSFHPKTTHRLGILHRMNLKNIDESLKWFEKTIQLDPYHFTSTMEYFKTIMGKLEQYDVALLMKKKLDSPESQGWSPLETADFYFLLGLAYFVKGEKEETLNWWAKVAKINEYPLTLIDLQDTFSFYEWDSQLVSSDKLRLWAKEEKDALAAKEKANEYVDPVKSKFVNRLFAFMLGRARPIRAPFVNSTHPDIFPRQHWEYFAVI